MARKSAGVSAIHRMRRVLETFTPNDSGLTLTEIARRASMPVSSVHGIAHQLADEGLLERGRGTFMLGVKLWEIAIRAPGTFGLRQAALRPMERAHAMIGHHVQLGILSQSEMLYIERLSSDDPVVNFTKIGGRLPWYRTSSGILLVALGDPDVRARLMDESPRPGWPSMPMDEASMRQWLRRVEHNRFVVSEGFVHPDATSIAVPIMSPWNSAVAALAAVVPSQGTDVEHVVATLRRAAREAGQGLADTLTRDDA